MEEERKDIGNLLMKSERVESKLMGSEGLKKNRMNVVLLQSRITKKKWQSKEQTARFPMAAL